MSHLDTRTRRRPRRWVPDRHGTVDLLAVVVLAGLAISGLATSFTGWSFLVVGLAGVLVATVVTHLCRAAGWPVIAPVVILIGVFLLLGGPLCLRSTGDTALLPTAPTLAGLADQVVFGWKDLLTTLPPVDGDGPLLVLPWVLGLVAGLVGVALAHARTPWPWLTALLPVLAMVAVLAAVLLLGVRHPHSLLLQGGAFAGVALAWLAVRSRRATATVRGGGPTWGRLVLGGATVALAAGLAVPASGLVVADADTGRAVARTWVEPPFDVGRYPSPLAAFRRYVDPRGQELPGNVHDETLFTVTGVPAGTRVRIAALDHYDGMVYGASNDAVPGAPGGTFQRVSATIDNPVPGRAVRATITVGEGWSGVWLPTIGALRSMEFLTGRSADLAESFRYNLATATAVVPAGLREGDRYAFTAALPDDSIGPDSVASAGATHVPQGTAFLEAPMTQWSGDETDPMARVLAVAAHLDQEGQYSDGVTRTERIHHPGHGIKRLSDEFVNAPAMVGNDEQYAAVMALLANRIGVPARVVMGAVVPEDGVVTGADVAAWVELRVADGTWRTLPTEAFMSQEPPAAQLPETEEPMTGTVIPPPAPIPPPSDAGEPSAADLKERKGKREQDDEEDGATAGGLPTWAVTLATFVGLPVLVVALVLGSILLAKSLRRRRRRRAGVVSARFVGAWRDLVDHAVDLGHPVPVGPTTTRREQSLALGAGPVAGLARRADGFVFGPVPPTAEAAEGYWERVDSQRRALSERATRWQRWRAAVSVASFGLGRRRRRSTTTGWTPS